jgi:hypothetical protein
MNHVAGLLDWPTLKKITPREVITIALEHGISFNWIRINLISSNGKIENKIPGYSANLR